VTTPTFTPRVSVVMCVRDAEPLVAQAVESILGQTLRDLELVVVDDASSDRSPDILANLARRDPRIRVHRSDARPGVAAASNLACEQARGRLIARLEADDVAEPQRLERQAAYLAERQRVVLVGGAAGVIDDAGKRYHLLRPPTGDAAIRAELVRRNCIIHPTVMLRREALLSVGGYRARFVLAEDYDPWLRLAERHQVANLPDVLVGYRVHPRQASHQDLERRVLVVLAAQALARRRRAGRREEPAGDRPITRAELAELGVPEAESLASRRPSSKARS
jgi:glycosyltransferase involved in cell wall biosynthesis